MMKEISVSTDYKIASTEVLSILKYLPQSEVDKIPIKFREFLKENSISNYNPTFDFSRGLDKIETKPKTKLLLAMIYQNYICSEKEKLEYNKILSQNEIAYQKYLKEKYNTENIFSKKNNLESENNNCNTSLIEYKESFFTRLKKYIFKIFHIHG